ncbi:MAG: hypothetical protein KatS3mg033_1177 [Thermonema sp.]|uniref:DUF2586 family protein n=1 Tax=Thermonema sp. TaxID=2231181 RepID=UPI0021DC3C20|nr:DUF2586 family protein [Thermonema sp.]GIV39377.1 MAG: hypothetical protein KatS3mg033_1177 [Thermonema sp.]
MRPKTQASSSPTAGTQDGVCLLVHNAPAAYSYSEQVFTSLKQAQDAGLSESADATYGYLLYEHIRDFYSENPNGEIHLLRLPEAATYNSLFTPGSAGYTTLSNYLSSQNGHISIVGFCLRPAVENHSGSLSDDLLSAIPMAHSFAMQEFAKLRPVVFIFEGRKFSGTAAAAADLRALEAGSCAVVIGRDRLRASALSSIDPNYAAIGLFLGSLSKVHVGRNVGRIRNGRVFGVQRPELSGGQALLRGSFSDDDFDIIHDKGYIFLDKYPGQSGFFWSDDPTCTSSYSSDAYISSVRVRNKAAKIAAATYVSRLKDGFEIAPSTGRLSPIVVKTLQNELERAIVQEMVTPADPGREREISGVSVRIDPEQNILATGKIVVNLTVYPLGVARTIETNIVIENPTNN